MGELHTLRLNSIAYVENPNESFIKLSHEIASSRYSDVYRYLKCINKGGVLTPPLRRDKKSRYF
jgi:hypothetical protein